jgi:hypothetical protein
MSIDNSLNAYCTGGIYYENLPENFELGNNWIVYSFSKISQENCLGNTDTFTRYMIYLKIVTTDTLTLETINDYVVNYLNSSIYGNIQDIVFVGDNHTIDLDKNIYMNTLNFDCIYC